MDIFVFICIIVAFFAGFGAAFVWQMQVKRTALTIVRDQAGEKGRKAKIEQDNDLMSLITDASLAFKQGKDAGEDIKVTAAKVVPALISKYPMVVAKHGKKLLKQFGGADGLMDMLE